MCTLLLLSFCAGLALGIILILPFAFLSPIVEDRMPRCGEIPPRREAP